MHNHELMMVKFGMFVHMPAMMNFLQAYSYRLLRSSVNWPRGFLFRITISIPAPLLVALLAHNRFTDFLDHRRPPKMATRAI